MVAREGLLTPVNLPSFWEVKKLADDKHFWLHKCAHSLMTVNKLEFPLLEPPPYRGGGVWVP